MCSSLLAGLWGNPTRYSTPAPYVSVGRYPASIWVTIAENCISGVQARRLHKLPGQKKEHGMDGEIDPKTFWKAIGCRAIGVAVGTARGTDGPAGFLAPPATP